MFLIRIKVPFMVSFESKGFCKGCYKGSVRVQGLQG